MTRPPVLFIPGPTEVPEDVLAACARPVIGHRGADFTRLAEGLQHKLARLLNAPGPVVLLSATATGAMEASLKNLVRRRCLVGVAGAWGAKFAEVGRALGLDTDVIEVPAGQAILPEALAAALSRADYEAVALVHNDTATGAMMPLAELAAVVKAVPQRLLIVDAVSSMAAVPLDMLALGIDVLFAGLQKAFACPPGAAVMALSPAALERAASIPARGLYFDFVRLAQSAAKFQTLTTPPIPLLYALDVQLDRILAEGLEARYARHGEMAARTQRWAAERFGLFAAEGYRSVTLTAVANTRGIDIAALIRRLRERRNVLIGNGYKELAEKTFRIGHMGEHTPESVSQLLGWIDELI